MQRMLCFSIVKIYLKFLTTPPRISISLASAVLTKGFPLVYISSVCLKAEKRAHHNALERRRRDHIKESFTNLREAVPTLKGEKVTVCSSDSVAPIQC